MLERGQHVDWLRLRFSDAEDDVDCTSTRGLFVRYADLRRIGAFHPRLLPHYLSDYEFTIRAHRRGFRLLVDPSLQLRMNPRTTGTHGEPQLPFRDFVRTYFSNRSSSNPLAWTAFIALAVPWPLKPWHLVRVWAGAAGALARALRR